MKTITTPLSKAVLLSLKAGEEVLLTGTVYTARDQAHSRMCSALAKGGKLPFDVKGAVIYYCGPTGTPKGKVIGSCGPTTSRRMDAFAPRLYAAGIAATIGKGSRSAAVAASAKKHGSVYFVTYAGCGALLNRRVRKMRNVAYPDLGPEAVYRLEVESFPLIVAIDAKGRSIYKPAT